MKLYRKTFGIWVPDRSLRDNRGFISPGIVGAVAGARRRTAAGYTAANSVLFDGNDSMSATVTAPSTSDQYTVSMWVKMGTDTGLRYIFMNRSGTSGPQVNCRINGTDLFFIATNSSSTTILNISMSSINVAAGWMWIAFSCDLSSTSTRTARVNRSAKTINVNTYTTGETIAWDRTNAYFGRDDGNGSRFNGYIQEVFIDNTYIDLSVTANQDIFFNSTTGLPAGDLSSRNPLIYLKDPYNTFNVNSGTLSSDYGTPFGSLADGGAITAIP